MSLASPQNDCERSLAAQIDDLYSSGWNEALEAVGAVIHSWDRPGADVSDLIAQLQKLQDAPSSNSTLGEKP